MAFTLDAASDVGRVRILINDSDSANYEFEDAEIEGIIDINEDDLWRSAADLCRSLAAKYAKAVQKLGLGKGDISIDNSKRSSDYLAMAARYDARSGSAVVEYADSINYNVDPYGSDKTEYIGEP
uniref:Uncharacterized protein n=1 Tax=viral metagenome TaxID=1070528 RepID=A0A6M3LDM5_9ZZZZ